MLEGKLFQNFENLILNRGTKIKLLHKPWYYKHFRWYKFLGFIERVKGFSEAKGVINRLIKWWFQFDVLACSRDRVVLIHLLW